MGRPLWFVKLLKNNYRRLKYFEPILKIPFFRKKLEGFVKKDKLFYIPKDIVIPVNQEVEKLDDMILPSKVVEYFINKAKYRWIMNFCICREGKKCKNYPHNLGCLFMGEAVININPQIGRLVSREEALNHVKKCREAGLVHTVGRNKLDELWLDAKPGHKLLTVCNCCECCCIARVFAHGGPKVSAIANRMPGVNVEVSDNCVGCGTCTKGVCLFEAINIVNKRAVIGKDCRGCGRCVTVCPREAIKLTIDDDAYIEKVIQEIDVLVDVT